MTALPKTPDFALARFHMVEAQLRPNHVHDVRVLDAMGAVPRELFVPEALRGLAYIDEDVPLTRERSLMEPMVLARLLQSAAIKPSDRALEIGTGSGYATAVLARLAREVVGVESDAMLAAAARDTLRTLGIGNARVEHGPLASGWRIDQPYDVIVINGAVDVVADPLLDQLAEGGRLIAVMNLPDCLGANGEARLYEKNHDHIAYRRLFDANIKPLPEFAAKKGFVF